MALLTLFLDPSISRIIFSCKYTCSTNCCHEHSHIMIYPHFSPFSGLSQTSLMMTMMMTMTTTTKPIHQQHVAKRGTCNWVLHFTDFRIYIVALCSLSLSCFSLFNVIKSHATVWSINTYTWNLNNFIRLP